MSPVDVETGHYMPSIVLQPSMFTDDGPTVVVDFTHLDANFGFDALGADARKAAALFRRIADRIDRLTAEATK